MAGEWRTVRLGDLTTWSSGGTPSKANPEFWNGDIPWISASSMKTTLLCDSDLKLTKAGLKNGSRLAETNSILLLVRGSELHKRIPVGVATRPVAFNQDVKALKVRGEMLSDYLFYWLLGNKTMLLGKVEQTGIGAGKLDTEVLKNLSVQLPPLSEQKRIASILGALDDKIELNRKMNATLEAMARALFQSWFVDFDPVRRNIDRKANASSQRPSSKSDSAAQAYSDASFSAYDHLFPDEFQDSELGHIPKGWRAARLGDVIDVFDSKRVPISGRERAQRQGVYPYHGAAGVMDHVDDYLFDGVYTLMGEDGSVINSDGTPVIQYVWGKFWVNNHAHVLRGKNGICTEHLLLHLKVSNIAAFVTGAVQLKLNQGNMNRIPFIHPSREVSEAFAKTVEPIFAQIRANTDQSRTLTTLRDTLLPKLLGGEISTITIS